MNLWPMVKPTGFFETKCNELKKHMKKGASHVSAPEENVKTTEA